MKREKVSVYNLFPIIEELLASNRQAIFNVKGTSMLPFIGDNRDQVMIKKVDFQKLKKGDIILFKYKEGGYVLHRIYNISNNRCQTIGDGLTEFDEWINYEDIIAVVFKIIRKGKEIDCDSLFWRGIFSLWMFLLPVRKYLLGFYKMLSKIKRFFK